MNEQVQDVYVEGMARGRQLPPPAVARRLRIAGRLTQRELAATIGVHRVSLARWEAGRVAPRGATAARYGAALAAILRGLT